MKKIFVFVALCAATMFIGCGKCAKNASSADSDTVAVDSVDSCVADTVIDTICVDTTVCPD